MKQYNVLISADAYYMVEANSSEEARELAYQQMKDDPSDLIHNAEAELAPEERLNYSDLSDRAKENALYQITKHGFLMEDNFGVVETYYPEDLENEAIKLKIETNIESIFEFDEHGNI